MSGGRLTSISRGLLAAHLVALVFGLVGILIMLPNPELWADDPNAVRVFNWAMKYAGSLHIVLGALAMFLIGGRLIGWRKVAIFAGASYGISLSSELIGTGSGWPFGNYSYTDFLGFKVMGRVPYTIPLSWFYMGLASYLIGIALVSRLPVRRVPLWEIAAGVWFLTVWDLVLDPAMAHPDLHVTFWQWHQEGPYFGMPLRNLVGWSITGLVFMVTARVLWRGPARLASAPTLPLVVYAANLLFAMVLSAQAHLWWPIVLSAVLGAVPALIAWAPRGAAAPVGRGKLVPNE